MLPSPSTGDGQACPAMLECGGDGTWLGKTSTMSYEPSALFLLLTGVYPALRGDLCLLISCLLLLVPSKVFYMSGPRSPGLLTSAF